MRKLEGDEWKAFVLAEPRPAICAIVLSDGRPHATPIWIDLDGDEIVFTTWHEGLKARVLPKYPRVSICVQDDQSPFASRRWPGPPQPPEPTTACTLHPWEKVGRSVRVVGIS